MARWSSKFDMASIPDSVLLAESARRMRARQLRAPRAKVLRQCPRCGEAFGARDLRAHIPRCSRRASILRQAGARVIRKVGSVEDQEAENYRYWQSIPVGHRLAAVNEVTEAAYSIQKAGRHADQGHERPDRRLQPGSR